MTEYLIITNSDNFIELYYAAESNDNLDKYVTVQVCMVPIRHRHTHHLCDVHDIVLSRRSKRWT